MTQVLVQAYGYILKFYKLFLSVADWARDMRNPVVGSCLPGVAGLGEGVLPGPDVEGHVVGA